MNYIVIDLEFNQSFDFPNGHKTVTDVKCPFEIIQIGAVKLDGDLQEIAQKSFMIKPQIYDRMHPFVEKITGISMKDLQFENTFDVVYKDFISFIGKGKSILCVWGSHDIKALYRNIMYYDLNSKVLTRKYINVQELASAYLNHTMNNSIGLKAAVETLNLDSNIEFHDALNDAIYTTQIFKILKKTNLQVQTFNLSHLKQRTMAKLTSINSGLLFTFAEKELKRKLNDYEKETIIKIYHAGQKHKFDTNNGEII